MCQKLEVSTKPFRNRLGLLLMVLVALVYSWFYNGANVNQTARYDVAFAFVEPGTPYTGTFKINEFVLGIAEDGIHGNTIDWARNETAGPDYYSNKAPLPSLLAIPVYAPVYWIERSFGQNPQDPHLTYLNCYLINLLVTVLPMALSAVLAYSLALSLVGLRPWPAFLTCIGLYFGTLAFPFSTQLWGHTLALAFCVVGAYFAFVEDRRWGPILAGLFFGMSVLCDYTCAIGVFAVGIWYLCRRRQQLLRYVAGGIPTLIVYMVYHKVCFDSFFIPASSFSNPQFISQGGVGGLFNFVSVLDAIKGLIVSPYRGLFWFMPCLLVVTFLPLLWKRIKHKDLVLLSGGAALGYLLLNISFNGWHAGYSSGPRYQIVALVWYFILAACVGQVLMISEGRKRPKLVSWACAFLVAISVSNMVIITTVSPMAMELTQDQSPTEKRVWSNPLRAFYPVFFKGIHQVSSPSFYAIRPGEIQGFPYRYKSFTLGKFIGLPGNYQVTPPIIFLLLGLFLAYRWRDTEMQTIETVQTNRENDCGTDDDVDESAKN